MAGIELVAIDDTTSVVGIKKELRWNQAYYQLARACRPRARRNGGANVCLRAEKVGTEEERDDEKTGTSARPEFGDDLREWLPVIARPQAGREVSAETRNVCEAAPGDARAESVTRGGVGWLDLGRTFRDGCQRWRLPGCW